MKRSKLLIPALSTAVIAVGAALPLVVSCGDKVKHYNVSINVNGDTDAITWSLQTNIAGKDLVIGINRVYGNINASKSTIILGKKKTRFEPAWYPENSDKIIIPHDVLAKATGEIVINLFAEQTDYKVKFEKDEHVNVNVVSNVIGEDLSYTISPSDSSKFEINYDNIRVEIDGVDQTSSLVKTKKDASHISLTFPTDSVEKTSNIVFYVYSREHVVKPYNITISISPLNGGTYNIQTNDQGEDIVIEWTHEEHVLLDKTTSSLLKNSDSTNWIDQLKDEKVSPTVTKLTIPQSLIAGLTEVDPISLVIGWKYESYSLDVDFAPAYMSYGQIMTQDIVNVLGKNIEIPFVINDGVFDFDEEFTTIQQDSKPINFVTEKLADNYYKIIIDANDITSTYSIQVRIFFKQIHYSVATDLPDGNIVTAVLKQNEVDEDLQWKLSFLAGYVFKSASYKIGEADALPANYDPTTQIVSIPASGLAGAGNNIVTLIVNCDVDETETITYCQSSIDDMEMIQRKDIEDSDEIVASSNSGQFTANFEVAQELNEGKEISVSIENWPAASIDKKPEIEIIDITPGSNISYFKTRLVWDHDPEITNDINFDIRMSFESTNITFTGFVVKGLSEYNVFESWFGNSSVFDAEAKSKTLGQNIQYSFKLKEDSEQEIISFSPTVGGNALPWNHSYDILTKAIDVQIDTTNVSKWDQVQLSVLTGYNMKMINSDKETIEDKQYTVLSSDAFTVQRKGNKDTDINNIYGTVETLGDFAKCKELYIRLEKLNKLGMNPNNVNFYINYQDNITMAEHVVFERASAEFQKAGYQYKIVNPLYNQPNGRFSFIYTIKREWTVESFTTSFSIAGYLG